MCVWCIYMNKEASGDSENPLTFRLTGFRRFYKLSKGMRVKCDIPVYRDVNTL